MSKRLKHLTSKLTYRVNKRRFVWGRCTKEDFIEAWYTASKKTNTDSWRCILKVHPSKANSFLKALEIYRTHDTREVPITCHVPTDHKEQNGQVRLFQVMSNIHAVEERILPYDIDNPLIIPIRHILALGNQMSLLGQPTLVVTKRRVAPKHPHETPLDAQYIQEDLPDWDKVTDSEERGQ